MTRYDFFRKRIAPVLFLGMVGLIAYDSCHKQDHAHATVVLDLGAAAPYVRSVDAQLVVGPDTLGTFKRAALPGSEIGPTRFEALVPEQTATLFVEVDVAGKIVHFDRKIVPFEGSTVTVPLERDLAAATP